MHTNQLHAGTAFPALPVQNQDGETIDISEPAGDADWPMVVVYRGKHCPWIRNPDNNYPIRGTHS